MKTAGIQIAAWVVLWLAVSQAPAQEILLQEGQTEPTEGTFTVPFAFYSDSLGPAVGASIGNRGYLQPQASAFATVVGSAAGTIYGFIAVRDLEVPELERLFINGQLNVGRFSQLDLYTPGNPDFAGKARAGSHNSDPENFIQGDGTDIKFWTMFGCVLPIGSGEAGPNSRLVLRDGLVLNGRDTSVWNPFRNGYTVAGIKPFYRKQTANTDEAGDREVTTDGAEFILHYENTDFAENPSRGSVQQVRYTRDWGVVNSSAPWETIDGSITRFISLSPGRLSRQRVLALNAWWIDTPSWNESNMEDGEEVFNRPPSFAGATLGGLDRMRGYPEARFNDRSAVYYGAEYRHIPFWNPLRDVGWLNSMNAHVQWIQYVAGLEVGRVADEFDLKELHSDVKVAGLFGLRLMVNSLIVRADVGITDEGGAVQMTIDQPF